MNVLKLSFVVAVLFTLVIDFFFGRSLLRLVSAPGAYKSHGLRVSHNVFHHTLAANYSGFDEWGAPYPYCTNAYGLRTVCGKQTSTNKKFEYALMGDSMIEGLGVPYEQTIAGVFQKLSRTEVANLSVSSYSPSIHLEKYKAYLAQGFQFNNIVIFLDISDVDDEANIYAREENGAVVDRKKVSQLTLFERRLRRKIEEITPLTWHSINVLKKKLKSFGKPVEESWTIESDRHSSRAGWTYLYNERDDAYRSSVHQGFIAAISAIKEIALIAQKHHTNLHVVLYPWPHQMVFDNSQTTLIEKWSKDAFDDTSIKLINLFPAFRKERKSRGTNQLIKDLYISKDTHFNAQGGEFVASLLYEHIRSRSRESLKRPEEAVVLLNPIL